jgi:hypothetical protein
MNSRFEIHVPALGAFVALAWSLAVAPAQAQEHCRLDNPQVISDRLEVTVACQQASSNQTVRYPAGSLSVGVTLYKIPESGLRNKVVPVVEDDTVEFAYVKPTEIERPTTPKKVVIPLGALGNKTHILLAVWDKKSACAAGDQTEGCTKAGVRLGEIDAFELPIPIDAWPRPVCNVEQLTSRGFFRWVETEGDFGGPQVPERFATMLATNDCFMRLPDRPGLGFSVRRWRAQPLPSR